jgi:putative membrane protein
MRQKLVVSLFVLAFSPLIWSAVQRPLNDGEIAQVMEVCQKIRFESASMALKKASTEELKNFAGYILTEYREEISPVPVFEKDQNKTVLELKKTVREISEKLSKLKGAEFDKAYLQAQLDLHRRLLMEIEKTLIPAAKSPELKKALSKVHDQMEEYVDETLDAYISVRK